MLVSLLRWICTLAIGVPCLTLISLMGFFSRVSAWRLFAAWSRIQCWIFGIRIKVHDRNQGAYGSGPYIFVQLNQTSLLEVLYWPLFLPAPTRFIENIEFALIPFLGWASVAMGGIPIVRQWAASSMRGLAQAERALKKNIGISVSIEGRRSEDGSLSPYKKGPVVMAISTQATLIPVYFRGARQRLPHGQWMPRPGVVEVTLCEPISTVGRRYEDRDSIVSQLRELALKERIEKEF